jgi:hypothetical protein
MTHVLGGACFVQQENEMDGIVFDTRQKLNESH